MSKVVVLQHVEAEGPAVLGEVLRAAGAALEVVRTDLGAPPEEVSEYDGVVVLGGPMSASSDSGFPTRQAELALLRAALDANVPTFGVCLGAQLLASAAGAPVYKSGKPEIGWGTVELGSLAASDPLFAQIASPLTVLHWHGETFDLPVGAAPLARSTLYPNQAFRLGSVAWGLQFHVEVDDTAVGRLLAAFREDALGVEGGTVAIAKATEDALRRLRPARERILGRFAHLVLEHSQERSRSPMA